MVKKKNVFFQTKCSCKIETLYKHFLIKCFAKTVAHSGNWHLLFCAIVILVALLGVGYVAFRSLNLLTKYQTMMN